MQKGYYFNDDVIYEEKQNSPNSLIFSVRYNDGNQTKTASFFLDSFPVTLSTDFISSGQELEKLVSKWHDNKELNQYPLTAYLADSHLIYVEKLNELKCKIDFGSRNYSVLNLTLPHDLNLINQLGSQWQKANYNKLIRMQTEALNKKVLLNDNLAKTIDIKNKIDILQQEIGDFVEKYIKDSWAEKKVLSARTRLGNEINNFFNSYEGEYTQANILRSLNKTKYSGLKKLIQNNGEFIINKKREVNKYVNKINILLKSINQKNSVLFNQKNNDYEIHLNNSTQNFENAGIKVTDEIFSLEEWLQQVFCFLDIEKPLWRKPDEKLSQELRGHLTNYRNNKINQERTIKRILKTLKDHSKGIDKVSSHLGVENSYFDAENISHIVEDKKIIEKLEDKLTIILGDKKIKLWEDKYDAKISRNCIMYKMENGRIVKTYYKIRRANDIKSINEFSVKQTETERDLLNASTRDMKKAKIHTIVGQVIPYDIIELRKGSKAVKADSFDVGMKGKLPRKVVARKQYQRLRGYAQEFIDTHRLGVIFHGYLRAGSKGSLALESLAAEVYRLNPDRLKNEKFRKSMSHEELRHFEVKSLNGDAEADTKIDSYGSLDVPPLKEMVLDVPFYLWALKLIQNNVLPWVSLTEIGFSPNVVSELYKMEQWKKSHNQKDFGLKQKERRDEVAIYKHRRDGIRKRWIKEAGIRSSNKNNGPVYQLYMPLEKHLKEEICVKYKQWKIIYDKLEKLDSIKQFGMLQYPKAFAREYLVDWFFWNREDKKYKNHTSGIENKLNGLFKNYESSIDKDILDDYFKYFKNLKRGYRSIFVSLKENPGRKHVKETIRVRSNKIESERQIDLNFSFISNNSFFKKDNFDLLKLKNISEDLESKLIKNEIKELKKFRTNFDKLNESTNQIKNIMKTKIPDQKDLFYENLIYLFNQKKIIESRKNRFKGAYWISPEDFGQKIEEFYQKIAQEVKHKRMQVVCQRGDYLYVKKDPNLDFQDSSFLFIREIKELSNKKRKAINLEDELKFAQQ